LLDHAQRDGLEGFITITGGKLMTYRLMAEWATDKICEKLNVSEKCTSAEQALRSVVSLPAPIRGSAVYRHGDLANKLLSNERSDKSLV
ncbi:anaerobic glycerol-3-phosphate dehydrogenase subunit A, partial [Proteus terrae]